MRILFVKLGAIGDIIQSAAALTVFKERFPATQIDWITGTGMRALVEATGTASRVIAVDEAAMIAGPPASRVLALARSMIQVARQCASRYDGIYTGYLNRRSRILTRGVRAPIRRTLGDPAERPNYLVHRNRVHEYWRLLTGEDSTSIDIAAATARLGAGMLKHSGAAPAPVPSAGYVVIAAGGAKNLHRDDALRRWPIQNFRATVEQLLREHRPVCLVGGEGDQWVSEAMRGLNVDDRIGKTSLVQLLGLMQGASAVLANDSGIFHLATLTTSGLVGLFGPTPANAVAPFGRPRMQILAADNRISCSPCYDGRNFAACTRNVCLESISVACVLDAIRQVG